MPLIATAIKTTTGMVTIDQTQPTAGQVLKATSPVTAQWVDSFPGLGVNFLGSYILNGELILSHAAETSVALVNSELIITNPNIYATATSSLTFNH